LPVVDAKTSLLFAAASPTPPERLQTPERHDRSKCGIQSHGPHSSRWLDPGPVAEVLARASFGESEDDVSSSAFPR
jgi:hypothetical protein